MLHYLTVFWNSGLVDAASQLLFPVPSVLKPAVSEVVSGGLGLKWPLVVTIIEGTFSDLAFKAGCLHLAVFKARNTK